MSNSLTSTVMASALAGLMAGSLAACGDKPDPPNAHDEAHGHEEGDKTATKKGEDAQPAKAGKHTCKGTNECKGKGGCAVAGKHDCAGKNECKGKGGCGMAPPAADGED